MSGKLFTPQSARRALERLRPRAEAMRRLFLTLERRGPGSAVPEHLVDPVYFSHLLRFFAAIHALQDAGVVVRDPRSGLLDFPARRGGRPVFLCWKVGEPGIRFWHEVDAGVAGRRPVDENGPWDHAAGRGGPGGDRMLD